MINFVFCLTSRHTFGKATLSQYLHWTSNSFGYYSEAAVRADIPIFEMERAKEGWVITPNNQLKENAKIKTEESSRKPTKLEETRDAFIALARK